MAKSSYIKTKYKYEKIEVNPYGLNPSAAKTRLQAYAFSQGFLISVASGSEQCGRIRYRCVHYGDAPRDRYSLTATAVTQKEYKASDGMSKTDSRKKLRQRQALVSQL
ncbi:hypothetical protein BDZ91DRAFT_720935 [Kalaharituber pfeilii]|nr:hypothetical protein BDZ91DRAFT_720935 [Kalaharituber pfeilii]